MNRKLVIYLDNCCNSRLFDGDTSPKVKAQADAIRRIICNRQRGGYFIVGSFVVETEIGQILDDEKRRIAEQYYMAYIDGAVGFSAHIIARAAKLELIGLKMMDARHLAAAEAAGAVFLLTTDEKFMRKCQNRNVTAVKVIDPIDFERR